MSEEVEGSMAADEKLAIIIVTYKRREHLEQLLDSGLALSTAPWRVFVVDNEASMETEALVRGYAEHAAMGETAVAWPEGADAFVYAPQEENTGGAGGFHAGMKLAYDAGADWFWLMDDDVELMPGSIDSLRKWMSDYEVIQGNKLDYDGGPFNWQYRFSEGLGIYNPIKQTVFASGPTLPTNAVCFEGGLIKRSVVDRIGFPDHRFFIYWDDCVYGYMASKVTDGVAVEDVVLRRTRNIENRELGGIRQLNSTSDITRFYIMRNRGHMGRYLKLNGDYRPALFALGTALSFAKEFIRLGLIDRSHFRSGTKQLIAGWKEARRILKDPNWEPVTLPGTAASTEAAASAHGETTAETASAREA